MIGPTLGRLVCRAVRAGAQDSLQRRPPQRHPPMGVCHLSEKQGQHTSVPVQAVGENFSVGKKTQQGNVAKFLLYQT